MRVREVWSYGLAAALREILACGPNMRGADADLPQLLVLCDDENRKPQAVLENRLSDEVDLSTRRKQAC
jgi:hypothetical protein